MKPPYMQMCMNHLKKSRRNALNRNNPSKMKTFRSTRTFRLKMVRKIPLVAAAILAEVEYSSPSIPALYRNQIDALYANPAAKNDQGQVSQKSMQHERISL